MQGDIMRLGECFKFNNNISTFALALRGSTHNNYIGPIRAICCNASRLASTYAVQCDVTKGNVDAIYLNVNGYLNSTT